MVAGGVFSVFRRRLPLAGKEERRGERRPRSRGGKRWFNHCVDHYIMASAFGLGFSAQTEDRGLRVQTPVEGLFRSVSDHTGMLRKAAIFANADWKNARIFASRRKKNVSSPWKNEGALPMYSPQVSQR